MGECGSKGTGCAAVATPDPNPNKSGKTLTQARYRIENMDCPTEEALIRGKRHWRGAHWPAFNLADIAISFDAVCLIAAAMRQGKSDDRNKNTNED